MKIEYKIIFFRPTVKKKGKMKGPHRESNQIKFLRRVQLKDRQFISLDFFNQLFTGFKLNPNALISTLVTLYSEDPSQDFLFKKWTMTHLSIRCVHHYRNSMQWKINSCQKDQRPFRKVPKESDHCQQR